MVAEKEDLQNNFMQLQSTHSILSDQLDQLHSKYSNLSNQLLELQADHTHLKAEHETTLHELHQLSTREESEGTPTDMQTQTSESNPSLVWIIEKKSSLS